jgi:hypothetical protein
MDFADELLRNLRRGFTLQYRSETWSGIFHPKKHYPVMVKEPVMCTKRTHVVYEHDISDTQYKVGLQPSVTPRQQDEAPE